MLNNPKRSKLLQSPPLHCAPNNHSWWLWHVQPHRLLEWKQASLQRALPLECIKSSADWQDTKKIAVATTFRDLYCRPTISSSKDDCTKSILLYWFIDTPRAPYITWRDALNYTEPLCCSTSTNYTDILENSPRKGCHDKPSQCHILMSGYRCRHWKLSELMWQIRSI